jgi:hypothetical protein
MVAGGRHSAHGPRRKVKEKANRRISNNEYPPAMHSALGYRKQ